MNRLERFHRINQMLQERRLVPRQAFLDELGISPATFKRDLEYLRDRFNAPVVWDRDAGGYRFDRAPGHGPRFELPGLWFTEQEAHALLTMQHLLASLDTGGLIGPHIAPLMDRLDAILGAGDATSRELRKRIQLIAAAQRHAPLEHFSTIGAALLKRRRLRLVYRARSTDETTEREVSPQRLVHYRDTWYLLGWCHLRNDLRAFALDAVHDARLLDVPAREVGERTVDRFPGAGYGIFGGDEVRWATLRFEPERARWVSAETWHPRQEGRFDAQGRYVLRLPYTDDRELMLDVLRHGAAVEVLEPAGLRAKVRDEHRRAAQRHR